MATYRRYISRYKLGKTAYINCPVCGNAITITKTKGVPDMNYICNAGHQIRMILYENVRKIHKERPILTPKQAEFVIKNLPNEELRAIAVLFYWAGPRINEGLTLRCHDIRLNDNILYIDMPTEKQEREGRKAIFTHIRPLQFNWTKLPFKNIFAQYYNVRGEDADRGTRLFHYSDRLVQLRMEQLSHKYPQKTGGDVWPHLFRKTRLQMLSDRGATTTQLRAFSGHKSIKSLDSYIERSVPQLKKIKDLIDS